LLKYPCLGFRRPSTPHSRPPSSLGGCLQQVYLPSDLPKRDAMHRHHLLCTTVKIYKYEVHTLSSGTWCPRACRRCIPSGSSGEVAK
jgi:hypothetical protein